MTDRQSSYLYVQDPMLCSPMDFLSTHWGLARIRESQVRRDSIIDIDPLA